MTQHKNQKNSIVSFLLSLLTHALVIVVLSIGLVQCHHIAQPDEITPSEPPPEVVLNLSPSLPEKKPTITANSDHFPKKAPEHAAFESDENSEAASELAPTGNDPLPTQEGHHDDDLQLKNQQHTSGDHSTAGSLNQPSVVMPSTISSASQPESSSTSTPNILSEHPTESALPKNTPLPAATPIAKSTPIPANEKPVMGTLSSAAKAQGYQDEERTSVIHGNISNKGKASVTAEATPLGRYKKNLSDAISSRWYYYIDDHMELLNFGTVTVSFYVTQQGKVEKLRILSNTSNQAFGDCCIKSIMEAKLPAIPPEVAATLQEEHLETEYRFTIYPN